MSKILVFLLDILMFLIEVGAAIGTWILRREKLAITLLVLFFIVLIGLPIGFLYWLISLVI